MLHQSRLITILLLALPVCTSGAWAQNRDDNAPPSEDEMVARAARRVSRISTERDRLIRLLDRTSPRTEGFTPSPTREAADWFGRPAARLGEWSPYTVAPA